MSTEDVSSWPAIYNVTDRRHFPPWFPEASYGLMGEEDPSWRGPGYWPPADAVTPTPPQPRGQDATCLPCDRRVAGDQRGDFWCEPGKPVYVRKRGMKVVRFKMEKCFGNRGLAGFDGASYDAGDVARQLLFAKDKAKEIEDKVIFLLRNKALTKGLYNEYRTWVKAHVKLRQDLVQILRDNPKALQKLASERGISPGEALVSVEGAVITNLVLTPEQVSSLGDLAIAPLAIAAWAVVGVASSIVAGITISHIAASDVELAKEQTARLDNLTKAAERVVAELPPDKRAGAIAQILKGAGPAVQQKLQGSFYDKLVDAATKPIGLAVGALVVYLAATRLVIPALKKKEQTP